MDPRTEESTNRPETLHLASCRDPRTSDFQMFVHDYKFCLVLARFDSPKLTIRFENKVLDFYLNRLEPISFHSLESCREN